MTVITALVCAELPKKVQITTKHIWCHHWRIQLVLWTLSQVSANFTTPVSSILSIILRVGCTQFCSSKSACHNSLSIWGILIIWFGSGWDYSLLVLLCLWVRNLFVGQIPRMLQLMCWTSTTCIQMATLRFQAVHSQTPYHLTCSYAIHIDHIMKIDSQDNIAAC